MVSIIDFLPILTIIATGAGLWQILNRFLRCNLRKTEYFNVFLLLGSFSLIIPLTWIGIQPNGTFILSLGSDSLTLVDFRGWCLTYLSIGLIIAMIAAYFLLRRLLVSLEHFQFDLSTLKNCQIALLGFLLLDYFILELILPLRGFDAFYFYFPETEVFYQAGRITEVNYLSFFPAVKSPLNVLIYVYSYYVTGKLSIQLIPFLFLLGLVSLVYDFSIELFNNQKLALIAAIFTLTLPLTYWLMNLWAFYQDLYLCYFFSVTCYFSLKWYRSPSKAGNGFLMTIGLITALLTKITGWILPLILILWLPTGFRGKVIRLMIIFLIGVFLCFQATTRIFIGVTLPIIVAFGAASYFLVKESTSENPVRPFFRLISIGVGIIFGSFWLNNRMSLSESVWEEIYNLYFHLNRSILWHYPTQVHDPLLHTLENVHRVNFISAVGILLLGSVFVLPWLILKVFSLKDFRPITAPLIWILIFFGIWATYYLDSSIRYLTPIITPMILCISWGFYQLTKKISDKTIQNFAVILFAFFGCFSFYYIIPFFPFLINLPLLNSILNSLVITNQTQEIIGNSYNQAAFDYYSNPIILMIFMVGISILFLILIRKDLVIQLLSLIERKTNSSKMKKLLQYLVQLFNSIRCRTFLKRVSPVVLLVTIIIPLGVQGYLLFYTKANITEFHAIHEYEYRAEYQELVTVIQQQNQPLSAIMTVRTPGLQFFTKQPVIDIYYQRELFPSDPFFTSTNLTELIVILQYPLNYTIETGLNLEQTISIKFIVIPAKSNLYYDVYIAEIKNRSLLFQSLEVNSSFTLLYSNSDYFLYEVFFEKNNI